MKKSIKNKLFKHVARATVILSLLPRPANADTSLNETLKKDGYQSYDVQATEDNTTSPKPPSLYQLLAEGDGYLLSNIRVDQKDTSSLIHPSIRNNSLVYGIGKNLYYDIFHNDFVIAGIPYEQYGEISSETLKFAGTPINDLTGEDILRGINQTLHGQNPLGLFELIDGFTLEDVLSGVIGLADDLQGGIATIEKTGSHLEATINNFHIPFKYTADLIGYITYKEGNTTISMASRYGLGYGMNVGLSAMVLSDTPTHEGIVAITEDHIAADIDLRLTTENVKEFTSNEWRIQKDRTRYGGYALFGIDTEKKKITTERYRINFNTDGAIGISPVTTLTEQETSLSMDTEKNKRIHDDVFIYIGGQIELSRGFSLDIGGYIGTLLRSTREKDTVSSTDLRISLPRRTITEYLTLIDDAIEIEESEEKTEIRSEHQEVGLAFSAYLLNDTKVFGIARRTILGIARDTDKSSYHLGNRTQIPQWGFIPRSLLQTHLTYNEGDRIFSLETVQDAELFIPITSDNESELLEQFSDYFDHRDIELFQRQQVRSRIEFAKLLNCQDFSGVSLRYDSRYNLGMYLSEGPFGIHPVVGIDENLSILDLSANLNLSGVLLDYSQSFFLKEGNQDQTFSVGLGVATTWRPYVVLQKDGDEETVYVSVAPLDGISFIEHGIEWMLDKLF
ncbi:MAG: hypothetical protein AABW49_04380 [Nanoarchaeota archaeon]